MERKKIYKRTQIYLNDRQHNNLNKDSQKLNVSKSEFIRRIIDKYYKNKENSQ